MCVRKSHPQGACKPPKEALRRGRKQTIQSIRGVGGAAFQAESRRIGKKWFGCNASFWSFFAKEGERARWPCGSSKPVGPSKKGTGGFDSLLLPPKMYNKNNNLSPQKPLKRPSPNRHQNAYEDGLPVMLQKLVKPLIRALGQGSL